MPKYMLIWRTTDKDAMDAAMGELSFEDMLEKMGRINDEFINAGVLLAAEGLDPDEHAVLTYADEEPVLTDGPYGETKELFGGFYLIQVSSKEEAIEWARKVCLFPGSAVEIRRVPTIDEFPQDNPWIQKEFAWRQKTGQV
ncbi:MAG: transcription initiation protein [Nocardioides sp.]|nr:transcription initiation protein [Nocardioides sp.]